MRSRFTRWLLYAIVVLLVAFAARYYFFRTVPVPVTVFVVARGTVEETVTNSKAGTVRTRRRASLSPEIGGRVAELPVREGQRVRAGETLLRLADDEARARVALSERTLAAAQAAERQACLTAEQAQREYDRYMSLQGDGIVSQELLDQRESERSVTRAACDTAKEQVLEARAGLAVARVETTKTLLRAPFDAVVSVVSAEVGEWITPSPPGLPMPAVLELIDSSAIYISAPLDEVDVSKIRVGQPVRVTLDAYPGRECAGNVVRVAPYVLDLEEHSRTFEIEVELADAGFAATLLPGTSADVEVILDVRADVPRLPSYALIEGERVLVVDSGKLVARQVRTGLANWAFTEITEGLEGGERIVVSLDRAEVKEGAEVEVVAETLK